MLLRAQSFDSSTDVNDFSSVFVAALDKITIKTGGAFNANYLAQDGNYYQFTNTQAFPVISPGNTGYAGFRYRAQSYNNGNQFKVQICDKSGLGHIGLYISITGQPVIYQMNGSNGNTVLFTGAVGQIPTGWCYIELGWLINATAGSVELRVNNQPLFKGVGIATQGNNTADAGSYAWTFYGAANLQDMYVADSTGIAPVNTFFGDVRVFEATPTGAGASSDFAPTGAATNWQVAAQSPPTPTTVYNTSAVVGATDLYTIAPIPSGLGAIFGVQVTGLLNKTDAGVRLAAMKIKSGASTAAGAGHSLQVTPFIYNDIFTIDPATGVAFTTAGVNALQFGPTIVS